MLWIPQKGDLRVEHNLTGTGAGVPGDAVTTHATESTKGTIVELIASTSFDAYWVRIMAFNYGVAGTASAGALDILIGAATEEVLIADLLMGNCGEGSSSGNGDGKVWDFPLHVPSGSRLSARAAGERVTTVVQVVVFLYGGDGSPPFRVGSKVTTYGMGTVPFGTTIVAGESGNDGAFTQITASTAVDHFAVFPSYQVQSDTSVQQNWHTLGIGVGAATEDEIAGDYLYHSNSSETLNGPINPMPTFHNIPASTRLTARNAIDGTANASQYGVVLHALS